MRATRLGALLLIPVVCAAAPDNAALRRQSAFVEAESFVPSGTEWRAGEGWADDIYSPTSGSAVLAHNDGAAGSATAAVTIPTAGAYNVWVRYLSIASYPGAFALRVEQPGRAAFEGVYRSDPSGGEWKETWEKAPAVLAAGPATLTLRIAKPGIRQRIDCVLITPVLDYRADYHDFAPQVFARLRLTKPTTPVRAEVRVYTPRGPRYYQYPGWLTSAGLGPDGPPIEAGSWSPWFELTQLMDSGSHTCTVKLAFLSQGKRVPNVAGEVQVGALPRAEGALTLREEIDGDISALVLPGDLSRYRDRVALASTLSKRHYERAISLKLPSMPPTRIPLETYVTGWDDAYRSERMLRWEMGAAAAIGLTSFNGAVGKRFGVASSVGATRGYLSDWFPDQLWQCPTAASNAAAADKHFAERASKMLAEDPSALKRTYRNILWDEPGSSDLKHLASCTSCLAGFAPFLQRNGLKPSDLGRSDWADVKPIAREAAVDPATRRLHTWSIQYRDWTNAQLVKVGSDMCRKHYGARMLTTVNFTNGPTSGWIDSMAWGPDWFLFGRLGAVTQMWSEDWASLGPEVSGVTSDLLRAAARPLALPVGQYIVANHLRTMAMRAWSALMHGTKTLHFYCWGPYYSFGDGMISDNLETQNVIGRLTRDIARVDAALYPATAPRAEVAILWGKSHEIWQRDAAVSTERRMVYLALQHAHIPVDFLCEEDVASGILSGYKALYVAESNLSRAAAVRVAAWVRAGGVLHLSAGAALVDEYDEPLSEVTGIAGVHVSNVAKPAGDYREHYGIPSRTAQGEVALPGCKLWPACRFPLIGYTETLELAGAQALATSVDGKPVVTVAKVGKGTVLRFSFMPGLGYVKGAKIQATDTITGFDASRCKVLLAAARLSGVVSPVEVSEPAVEAQFLRGPKADVVMLANWGYARLSAVRVVVRGGAGCGPIRASSGAAVKVARAGRDAHITVPIDQIEAIILSKRTPAKRAR